MSLPLLGLTVAVGAMVGSFLNVCIHRLPRRESLVAPRSHCPACGAAVAPYDNIPVVSYLILRGRCRRCRCRIPWRYPLVEGLTATLFLLAADRYGLGPRGLLLMLFLAGLVVIAFIDLQHQIVPDRISLPGIGVGLLGSLLWPPPSALQALLGVLAGGGVFFVVATASRGGMGGGDIKLGAMIGAFLGWRLAIVTMFLGILLGSVVAIALLILRLKRRKDPIPFGPFLALGAVVALFWGQEVLAWYWGLFP